MVTNECESAVAYVDAAVKRAEADANRSIEQAKREPKSVQAARRNALFRWLANQEARASH